MAPKLPGRGSAVEMTHPYRRIVKLVMPRPQPSRTNPILHQTSPSLAENPILHQTSPSLAEMKVRTPIRSYRRPMMTVPTDSVGGCRLLRRAPIVEAPKHPAADRDSYARLVRLRMHHDRRRTIVPMICRRRRPANLVPSDPMDECASSRRLGVAKDGGYRTALHPFDAAAAGRMVVLPFLRFAVPASIHRRMIAQNCRDSSRTSTCDSRGMPQSDAVLKTARVGKIRRGYVRIFRGREMICRGREMTCRSRDMDGMPHPDCEALVILETETDCGGDDLRVGIDRRGACLAWSATTCSGI
jgi:hypothetical protein